MDLRVPSVRTCDASCNSIERGVVNKMLRASMVPTTCLSCKQARHPFKIYAFRMVDHSTRAQSVLRYFRAVETHHLDWFSQLSAPTVAYRARGLLQGSGFDTRGPTNIYAELSKKYEQYTDLVYSIHTYAEEGNQLMLHWTATGTNRVGVFNKPATYEPSIFSGATLFTFDSKGRVLEVLEFRQPTREEAAELLLPGVELNVEFCPSNDAPLPVAATGSNEWVVNARNACSVWMETVSSHNFQVLQNFVARDVKVQNSRSWPSFAPDTVGFDALVMSWAQEKEAKTQVHSMIVDPGSSTVAVHYTSESCHLSESSSGLLIFTLTEAGVIRRVVSFRELSGEEKEKYLKHVSHCAHA